MKKCLLLLVASLLFTVSAAAAPANCLDEFPGVPLITLLDPVAPGFEEGCLVQDKLFSNFNYVQGGLANPDPTQVLVTFALTAGPNSPQGDLHTVSFTSNFVSWTLPFELSYNVEVFTAPPGTSIVEANFDLNVANSGTSAFGTKTLTGNGTTYVLNATVGSNDSATINQETALGVLMVVDPNGDAVNSLVDSYTQAGIPEPGTWALLGGGLVLLGALRRRKG